MRESQTEDMMGSEEENNLLADDGPVGQIEILEQSDEDLLSTTKGVSLG